MCHLSVFSWFSAAEIKVPGGLALEPVHLLAPVIKVGGLNLSEHRRREDTCQEAGNKRQEKEKNKNWIRLSKELLLSVNAPCGTTQILGAGGRIVEASLRR